jgi:O-methyltransferase involved in polyketide biosynthesis
MKPDPTCPTSRVIDIIDDLLREELVANPNLTVVIIGAGFDTRAFRLQGGTWIELDEPQ